HLARLAEAGLLEPTAQGRHRYFRLASPAVARMVEGVMGVAEELSRRPLPITGPRDAGLRRARTCYDHLAGKLGVSITDALVGAGHLELGLDAGELTDSGLSLFDRLGMDVGAIHQKKGRIL
ncbi:transcriptional regulator, partial [Escherichia coli]|nr:transcriptional regulator [Escherichia coli]